ncbi:Ribonuclease H-like domain containing protein [Trema orientale]|uniref:Ribonuclease H-like domain containing protein n=1 Tax=Trema orientale TaxID=63057 RepID=A0A2P5DB32_TREOI|nr:Ribonuclease H-like domain containing protein [Trema orientale]
MVKVQAAALEVQPGRDIGHPSVWIPPPPKWYKINSDVAVRSDHSVCSAVGRDSQGVIVFATTTRVNVTEPSVGEALALKEGLSQVLLRKLQPAVLESDCQELISTLQGSLQPAWNICSIVEEILLMARCVGVIEFSYTPRSTNYLAHNLAKWADRHNVLSALDVNSIPDFVCNDFILPDSILGD